MTIMERKARNAAADEASRVQIEGGIEGMIMYSLAATAVCAVLHQTWPLFRRQTLAGKAFLVSGAAMSGLVIKAEDKLQRYEYKQKRIWNEERSKATTALAAMGSIGSEAEITSWLQKQHELEKTEQATTTPQPSSTILSSLAHSVSTSVLPPASSTFSPSSFSATPSHPETFGKTGAELEEDFLEVLVKVEE